MTSRPEPKLQITQAMIDAYDDYTHLTLDRRAFMEKLTRLAGSAAAAAAIAPMLAADPAHAAIVPPNDERVTDEIVTFPGPERGTELKGYLARPAGQSSGLPAVIVIHENRGLNDHIRDIARRLAIEGFLVLAPDYLSSQGGTPQDEDRARQMISSLDRQDVIDDGIAAIAYLQSHEAGNGQVGVVGFCWGGGAANDLAAYASSLDAAVAYYGEQPNAEEAARISAPLLLHYAGKDERVNAGIEAYKAALESNDKRYTIHIYEGAQHAFNNDTSKARFDRQAAELSWRRTVDFLKSELS